VEDAERSRTPVADARDAADHLFDLLRSVLLAADHDQVLGARGEVEIAALVEVPLVAGVRPPVDERPARLVGIPVVAREERVRAEPDRAHDPGRDGLPSIPPHLAVAAPE